jgi:hypothetical protein
MEAKAVRVGTQLWGGILPKHRGSSHQRVQYVYPLRSRWPRIIPRAHAVVRFNLSQIDLPAPVEQGKAGRSGMIPAATRHLGT